MGERTPPCAFEKGLFPSCCDVMVAWFLAAEFIGLDLSKIPYLTLQPNDFASMLKISNKMSGRDTVEIQEP